MSKKSKRKSKSLPSRVDPQSCTFVAPRVLCTGGIYTDYICQVSEEFVASLPGGKGSTLDIDKAQFDELLERIPPEKYLRQVGGCIANTAVNAAILQPAGFAGVLCVVGDDERGHECETQLRGRGVDTTRLHVLPGETTGACIVLVTPDGERTMRTFQGANLRFFEFANWSENDLENVGVAYLDAYLMQQEPAFLNYVLKLSIANVVVHLDMGSPQVVAAHHQLLCGNLPSIVDTVYANQPEAEALTGESDPAKALRELLELYPHAFVKCGADGAWFRNESGEPELMPSNERFEGVNTTGCGDAWAGGFLSSRLSGASDREAVEQANRYAELALLCNKIQKLKAQVQKL